jgi:N4-gp56 family major capsid protein
MAVTVRNSSWGGSATTTSELLVGYITDKIRVLEPELQYARLGKMKNIPKGYDRLVFPQSNQIPVKINTSMVTVGGPGGAAGGGSVWGAGASIQGGAAATAPGFPVSSTEGVAAITEGTNPTSITWGATSYASGPAQYGLLVQVSDLLVQNSAIEVIDEATMQVRNALARLVDTIIQTVVNAGTNGVIYSGGKTSRSTLGAGDLLTQNDMVRAVKYLRSSNAAGLQPFSGEYYAAVIHPMAMGDLMQNTATGSWSDMGRYSNVDDLKSGKMSTFRGVRYLETAHQSYYNSTVPVLPTTLLGQDSFGWGYFQEPQAILTNSSDSNNPLNLYTSIGGKVALGVTRFEDQVGISVSLAWNPHSATSLLSLPLTGAGHSTLWLPYLPYSPSPERNRSPIATD